MRCAARKCAWTPVLFHLHFSRCLYCKQIGCVYQPVCIADNTQLYYAYRTRPSMMQSPNLQNCLYNVVFLSQYVDVNAYVVCSREVCLDPRVLSPTFLPFLYLQVQRSPWFSQNRIIVINPEKSEAVRQLYYRTYASPRIIKYRH